MTTMDTHGHDNHDHHPRQGHHWATMEQQFEAGKLGMWLFLGTEFLLFGGLFCAYAVFRHNQPELFAWGSQFLDTKYGAINTVILIASSMTMAFGVSAAQMGKRGPLIILLLLTILGGFGFMTIKYIEYKHKFEQHILWGTHLYEPTEHEHYMPMVQAPVGEAEMKSAALVFAEDGTPLPVTAIAPPKEAAGGLVLPDESAAETEGHGDEHAAEAGGHGPNPRSTPGRPPNAHIFFGIYFCMTGLHGIHVLIGMSVIGWLTFRAWKGEFGPKYFTPVDLGGLYWHVVDLIWIFLFPMLYLI